MTTKPTILAVLIAACGPSTGTDGSSAEGTGGSDSGGSTSTGQGQTSTEDGSSSGALESTGSESTGSSSGGSSSSSTGGSSSSESTDGSTGETVCVLVPALTSQRCECDGDQADPILCGCVFVAAGCECDGVLVPDVITCAWPCDVTPLGGCICGNFPAPPDFCP